MTFLKDIACRIGHDLNTMERYIALTIYEKCKFHLVNGQNPVHILRNRKAYNNDEAHKASDVLSCQVEKVLNGMMISVYLKLVGDDPW